MASYRQLPNRIFSPMPKAEGTYRAEIDGLRALAVIPVVLFHANAEWLENGFIGVDIFFVISGYLIAGLLMGNDRDHNFPIRQFYERRIRRIAPALITVIICTALLSFFVASPFRMIEIAKSIVAACLFAANFWFLSRDVYFATPSTFQPLIHLWSLAVEEQFYIGFPLVLALLARYSRVHKVAALSALAVGSLGYSQYLSAYQANAAFFRPDTRSWELLLGALCTFCPPVAARWREPFALLGVTLISLAYIALPKPSAPNLLALPVCFGASLVILGAGRETWTGRVLGTKWLVLIGLASYSLYLWHQPLLALARIAKLGPLSGFETAEVLAISFALSLLTWRFVEMPTRQRDLISGRSILAGATAGTAVLLIFAVSALATMGFAFRYGGEAGRYLATVDFLNDDSDARKAAIRMGTCQFRADMSPPIDKFLQNWNCAGSESGKGILVVGDSHAAELAAGFKLNGMDIGQMTGAGCWLAPQKMTRECRALFDLVTSRRGQFKTIVMANDQTYKIYTESEIQSVLAYWGRLHLPIVWLSDMPQFSALNDRKVKNLAKFASDMAGEYPILLDAAQSNYRTMNRIAAGRFEVLDSSSTYCSISSDKHSCLPYEPGVGWLALETGHLTPLGARLFVKSLLARYRAFE